MIRFWGMGGMGLRRSGLAVYKFYEAEGLMGLKWRCFSLDEIYLG